VILDCEVAINPSGTIILPGGSLTFTAETTCDGVVQKLAAAPNYTWEISEAGCTGGSIDAATGTYTAGAEDNGCSDTVMVTDTANGGVEATATVAVTDTLPVVDITGPLDVGPPCPDQATYTAETTLSGDPISGTYTWEIDGVSQGTGNTGNTFQFTCTEDGPHTLMVTDTQNGNITDSVVFGCDCTVGIEPSIDASFTGCGSPILYWFGIVSIQGTDTVFGPFTSLSYDSPAILKGLRLVNSNLQTINQFVLLAPSILFPGLIGPALDYPTTVEVTVGGFPAVGDGLSDTFVIPACGG
jgi:hypothetical protein